MDFLSTVYFIPNDVCGIVRDYLSGNKDYWKCNFADVVQQVQYRAIARDCWRDAGFYSYGFALFPADYIPTGQVNVSRCETPFGFYEYK